MLFIIVKLTCI